MRLLLEGKCEANVVDALGNTPLHYAAQRGTHGVLPGYSRGTHGVRTGYARGTHGVLEGYSRRGTTPRSGKWPHTRHKYVYVRATCELVCADICA